MSPTALGLFGGTFDPIHFGHLAPVGQARDLMRLGRVFYLPNKIPPHRDPASADGAYRLAMVRIGIAGRAGLAVDDRELRRPGPSYTVDTLEEYAAEHPTRPIWLLLGRDAFDGLPGWHRFERIVELAGLAVMDRQTGGAGNPWWRGRQVTLESIGDGCAAGRVVFLNTRRRNVSATDIRRRLAAGESTARLVPAAVRRYIDEHGLYGTAAQSAGRRFATG